MKSWWRPFQSFLEDKKNMTWDQMETTTEFRTMLRLFLEKLIKRKLIITLLSISVIFFLMLTTQSSNSTLNLLGTSSVTDLLLPSSPLKWSYSKEKHSAINLHNKMYPDTACLPHSLHRLNISQPRPRLIKLSRRLTYRQNRSHLPQ